MYRVGLIFIKDKYFLSNVIILSLIWPINLIFSITVLRETPIQLTFIISFYYLLKYIKELKVRYIISALIYSIIATLFHSGMIVLVIIYILKV